MSTIRARAAWWWRALSLVVALTFLSFLVSGISSFASRYHQSSDKLLWITALALGGLISFLSVRFVLKTFATYVGDESGINLRSWLGASGISWDEIGRYDLRASNDEIMYTLYDREGRRRLAMDFSMLEDEGEPLLELLVRKLREVLPDQDREPPTFFKVLLPDARIPDDPAKRFVALRKWAKTYLLLALTVIMFGLFMVAWAIRDSYSEWLLRRDGRTTVALIAAKDDRHKQVTYRFRAENGGVYEGKASLDSGEFERLQPGDPLEIHYAPTRPALNRTKDQAGFDAQLLPAAIGAIFLIGSARWWRARRRALRLLHSQ